MERTHSIAELLRLIERDYHKDKALAEKGANGWIYLSHKDLLNEVKAMALYLNSIGIKKGDMVGILATSGIRWVIVDLAIMACGGITVPLFANISSENFIFECKQTNLKTLFIQGAEAWRMYGQHRALFERVIALDTPPSGEKADTFEKAIKIGLSIRGQNPKLFDHLLDEIREIDLATIIYTSSSTGIPKGVMLTHKNILFAGFTNFTEIKDTDRFLSVLPLAHVFQRIVILYLLRWNVTIYFYNDPKTINNALQEIKPTFTAFVPRIIEKIYTQIMTRLNQEGALMQAIGQWAFGLALDKDFENRLLHELADTFVYQKVRDAFGGKLRGIVSGSAALNPALVRFFHHIGIPIFEGYGMTEMMVISSNTFDQCKIGTVGQPCPDVEVKLSPEGEVLVRSDGVMQGYYKNPESTKRALDKDGWLHTGDKGLIDSEGYLTILGRTKEIVKTSTGEWIALVPLEQELTKTPLVEFAMVVAEKEKFVSALIFPNFELVHALKKSQNSTQLTDEEFLKTDYIKREMDKLIEKINAHHNHWEKIHAYRFILSPPSIETGELTPTLKLRRENIVQKYKSLIDSMYPEDLSKKVKEQ